jgi:hypothetical protein
MIDSPRPNMSSAVRSFAAKSSLRGSLCIRT